MTFYQGRLMWPVSFQDRKVSMSPWDLGRLPILRDLLEGCMINGETPNLVFPFTWEQFSSAWHDTFLSDYSTVYNPRSFINDRNFVDFFGLSKDFSFIHPGRANKYLDLTEEEVRELFRHLFNSGETPIYYVSCVDAKKICQEDKDAIMKAFLNMTVSNPLENIKLVRDNLGALIELEIDWEKYISPLISDYLKFGYNPSHKYFLASVGKVCPDLKIKEMIDQVVSGDSYFGNLFD